VARESNPQSKDGLIFINDGGGVVRRAPWPFPFTRWAIADGDGLVAAVGDDDEGFGPSRIVRVDSRGRIRWRSAIDEFSEAVPTQDGQIAAIVRRGNNDKLRLVRFADP